ncbi:hypothetical protein M5D96_002358 [Drosophila gunungcola]|uniref:Uncharacterized protein n=1 Tax=Drosophila gunungcola TaxID=103775 RepID=A0A9P9YZS3_9MUSC|nr:hypothetical protein M5D96_002358 [Drosophila gunungcola]
MDFPGSTRVLQSHYLNPNKSKLRSPYFSHLVMSVRLFDSPHPRRSKRPTWVSVSVWDSDSEPAGGACSTSSLFTQRSPQSPLMNGPHCECYEIKSLVCLSSQHFEWR